MSQEVKTSPEHSSAEKHFSHPLQNPRMNFPFSPTVDLSHFAAKPPGNFQVKLYCIKVKMISTITSEGLMSSSTQDRVDFQRGFLQADWPSCLAGCVRLANMPHFSILLIRIVKPLSWGRFSGCQGWFWEELVLVLRFVSFIVCMEVLRSQCWFWFRVVDSIFMSMKVMSGWSRIQKIS